MVPLHNESAWRLVIWPHSLAAQEFHGPPWSFQVGRFGGDEPARGGGAEDLQFGAGAGEEADGVAGLGGELEAARAGHVHARRVGDDAAHALAAQGEVDAPEARR